MMAAVMAVPLDYNWAIQKADKWVAMMAAMMAVMMAPTMVATMAALLDCRLAA